MNKKALRLGDYLEHMCDKSLTEFSVDEQLQDAVIRNIEIIGEAAHNVAIHAPSFVRQHDDIPWAALYAMTTTTTSTYGLPGTALRQLLDVLSAAPGVEHILLHGSRAKGAHRPASNIDSCLVAPTLGLDMKIGELLKLPRKIDLSLWHQIDNRCCSSTYSDSASIQRSADSPEPQPSLQAKVPDSDRTDPSVIRGNKRSTIWPGKISLRLQGSGTVRAVR